MALFGLMELIAGATAAMLVDKIVSRFGNNNTMALAIAATGISSLLMAVAPHLSLTLVAAFLSGAGWTLTGITLFGYFTEQTRGVPPEEMTRYSGAYYQTIAVSVFIGPLLGSTLANAGVSLVPLLIAGAALRFIAGMLARRKVVERVALPSHNTYPAGASGD
jgi:MFS family permease